MTTKLQQNAVVGASGNVGGLRARAILDAGDKHKLTFTRENDPRTSLARGLKEWLEQWSINWVGGRLLKFENFEVSWAEPEVPLQLPSGVLVGNGPAFYKDSELSPQLFQVDAAEEEKEGRYIRSVSEVKQSFDFIIWTTDSVARQGLVAMCEDLLDPAEFMTGLRLELPYYFNQRATYEKLSLTYDDDESTAHTRFRRAIFRVVGQVPQMVPVGDLPKMNIRSQIEVIDTASEAGC